jgi:TatD DNase family protein
VRLADSHCHLDDAQFDSDRTEMLARARASGIQYMLAIGTGNGPPDLHAAVRLADEHEDIYATVGVHPNDAPKIDESTLTRIQELLQRPKVRALGEIGLDYHWGVPKEVQVPVFRRQLAIAAETKMPVIIHTRDAWTDTLDILRQDWAPTGLPCVMHCFTGNAAQARECIELGFYLAFGGVSTFPKSTGIREAASITPIERLLLETDAPYLAPVPHRGKRNEPSFLGYTAQTIADVRRISPEELGAASTQNLERLLSIQPLH